MQPILWLILAAIHAMPALAFFRPATLTSLYRLQPDNPLFLLMQHRAGLFVAVFVACAYAAFIPEGRRAGGADRGHQHGELPRPLLAGRVAAALEAYRASRPLGATCSGRGGVAGFPALIRHL